MIFLIQLLGTGSLALLALCLYLVFTERSQIEPSPVRASETAAANGTVEQDNFELPSPLPQSAFDQILERPVFAATRRPIQIDEEIAAPIVNDTPEIPKDILRPEMELLGIIKDESRQAALLAVEGNLPEWFELGTVLSGWRLSAINANWIEFTRDGKFEREEMYTP